MKKSLAAKCLPLFLIIMASAAAADGLKPSACEGLMESAGTAPPRWNGIAVPVPDISKLTSAKANDDVSAALDATFESVIAIYPPPTQDLVRKMYYDNLNVMTSLPFDHESVAVHGFERVEAGNIIKVYLNRDISKNPVISRWIKIHEIGVHAGQEDMRIRASIPSSREFTAFTELSAATVDWMIAQAVSPAQWRKAFGFSSNLPWSASGDFYGYADEAKKTSLADWLQWTQRRYRAAFWGLAPTWSGFEVIDEARRLAGL